MYGSNINLEPEHTEGYKPWRPCSCCCLACTIRDRGYRTEHEIYSLLQSAKIHESVAVDQ